MPSVVHLCEPAGFWGKLGKWPLFRRRFWGRHGIIGRPALEHNAGTPRLELAATLKAALMRSPMKPLARLRNTVFTARDCARVFIRELKQGTSTVIAKHGQQLGGNLVDRWLAEEFCERLHFPLRARDSEEQRFGWLMLLEEARRVKESVFFNDKDAFYLTPREDMRAFEARVRGEPNLLEVRRATIVEVLDKRGWYRDIEAMVDTVVADAERAGARIDEVLKKLGGQGDNASEQIVVPLNADNPTLDELESPHGPGDRRPRLEIAFGVNAERWLIATVRDLETQRELMNEKPVVRII